jgi:serine/threonine-protein kinase HipA
MSEHRLFVFANREPVGELTFEARDERFGFRYAPAWREGAHGFAISPHIPLEGEVHSSAVRRFLENLLPEGRALDIVTTTYQVSRNNIYGLVRSLGRETSGALSFHAEEQRPPATAERREVTHEELHARIAERAQIPFAVWDGKVRLSIAGYQDKLAVYIEDERLFLVEGALASTHILKPEPQEERLHHLVANEHFCMQLAARVGLSVADTAILRTPEPVLVVKRFDREKRDSAVERRHLIDACQALDLPVAFKYERNFGNGPDVRDIRDGVSFQKLFSIADRTVAPALTRRDLLRWAVFQLLIGNADAHGKNVSFFCARAGCSLAPAYDLVSVVPYAHIDRELAMAYGDEFQLSQVMAADLALFAEHAGIGRSVLVREMRRLARASAAAAAAQLAEATYSDEERAFLQPIAAFVEQQAARLTELAPVTARVEF